MRPAHGYFGAVLRVDLTERRAWQEPLDAPTLRAFVGGVGLAVYLLYRYGPPNVDPLSPNNPLIFASSPLVGTRITTTAKFAIASKSPQTGFVGDSLSSSYLALELKKLGVDALVVTGAADRPLALVVDGDAVAYANVADLWGLDTEAAERVLRERLGARFRVATIGPAGERLVRYATIANDGRHAGRTGNGAVMGSKRLKAIAVAGHAVCPSAHPDTLRERARDLARRSLGPATAKYRELGTVANVAVFNRLAALPAYNFRQSTFEHAEALSGETLHALSAHAAAADAQAGRTDRHGCASCTIGCEHRFEAGGVGGRLEYESLYALGPLCGIADPGAVLRAARRCDALGLDTISTGATIAWAMESAEAGVLTPSDLKGLDLRFGSATGLLAAIDLIGRREGLGDLLAEGSRRAATAVGGGSDAWAMHVKGLELPGYEPRSLKTLALGLAVGSRGACHNRSAAYEADFSDRVDRLTADRGRGAIAADAEDQAALLDSLILCKFVRRCLSDYYGESATLLSLVTGWDWTGAELRVAAERITTLKKLFNLREGWTHADDILPARLLAEPLPTGVAAGVGLSRAELDLMIDAYYEARGWTPDGRVPPAKLAALGLADLLAAADRPSALHDSQARRASTGDPETR